MDNEATRLLNDEQVNNKTPQTDTPQAKKTKKNSNTTGAAAGGFVAGVAAGAGATAAAQNQTNSAPIDEIKAEEENYDLPSSETPDQDIQENPATLDGTIEIPEPDQVILANDEGIRYAHVEADNFSDAFVQARAQVGAGGVFEYNGQLYGTYTAEEWNNMSAQERADYHHRVFDSHASNHSDVAYTHVDSTPNTEVVATNEEMIAPEPVDSEIRVLGVDVVENETGDMMHVALVECEGDQALLVDVDFDGTMDVLIHDDNNNGVIDSGEIYDMTDANVQVSDLMQLQAAQSGDMFLAANDDIPDYFNDADSMMTI